MVEAADHKRRARLTPAEVEYLSSIYNQHWEHGRSHEGLRGVSTGLFMALIGGALAFSASSDVPAAETIGGVTIAIASILGLLLNIKHYERFKFHQHMTNRARDVMARYIRRDVAEVGETVKAPFAKRHPMISQMQVQWLWAIIFLLTLALGTVLTVEGIWNDRSVRHPTAEVQVPTVINVTVGRPDEPARPLQPQRDQRHGRRSAEPR